MEAGVRVGPNLDSDADIDAEARGELPGDLVVQTGKLLLGAERVGLDAAVETLPARWRSVVSGTGWTLGPWPDCIEASGARCRLHGPCSGISLGIPGSSDWLDQQQRGIQGRRGTPAETEADIAPVLLALREAEELPAVPVGRYPRVLRSVPDRCGLAHLPQQWALPGHSCARPALQPCCNRQDQAHPKARSGSLGRGRGLWWLPLLLPAACPPLR